MRRLLYRFVLLNIAIFLVTMVGVLVARQFIDPENRPYHQVRSVLAESLEIHDPAALEAQLDRLRARSDARLSVYSQDGELIASSIDPPLPVDARDIGVFGGYVDMLDEHGKVRARVVTSPPIGWFLRKVASDLLLVTLLVCGFALPVVIWGTRRVSAPLETLVEAARRLGRGELDTRADLERDDEIGEVGDAFDEMAARLGLLVRSQRELLTNVSHEFRTPLARMRVVSEMLAGGDDVRELLPELDTDIAELERLVEGVLESASLDLRAAAPKRPRPVQTLAAGELVERIAARFGLAHPERELELDLELGVELPDVRIDLDAVLRAFDNLLANANAYSPADAEIRVRAHAESNELIVEVIDRGLGIADRDLPLIFTPFFRADRSRARHTGGLGLGLANCQKIVEAEGGAIEVQSRVGEGSCFAVRLPAADANRAKPQG